MIVVVVIAAFSIVLIFSGISIGSVVFAQQQENTSTTGH